MTAEGALTTALLLISVIRKAPAGQMLSNIPIICIC